MLRRVLPVAIALVVVAVLAVVSAVVFVGGDKQNHYTAHFVKTPGLYLGASVRVLGVPVGTVDKITPQGTSVAIAMSVDAKRAIPADVQAYIVPPSLVSDRYVQLGPIYKDGPKLADNGDIALKSSHSPVELDEIYKSLDQLNVALGPQGANSNGALSDLLHVGAQNLNGNGPQINQTLKDVANLVGTLDDNKSGLFNVVDNLSSFTSNIAANDNALNQVYGNLANVSVQLNEERFKLADAFKNLSVALGEVADFVNTNKGDLTTDLSGLKDVTGVLVKQKASLEEFVDDGGTGLVNLRGTFDPNLNAISTRGPVSQDFNAQLCQLVKNAGLPASTCDAIKTLGLPGGASPTSSGAGAAASRQLVPGVATPGASSLVGDTPAGGLDALLGVK